MLCCIQKTKAKTPRAKNPRVVVKAEQGVETSHDEIESFFEEDFKCIDCNTPLEGIKDCYPESEREDGLIFRCLPCYNKTANFLKSVNASAQKTREEVKERLALKKAELAVEVAAAAAEKKEKMAAKAKEKAAVAADKKDKKDKKEVRMFVIVMSIYILHRCFSTPSLFVINMSECCMAEKETQKKIEVQLQIPGE